MSKYKIYIVEDDEVIGAVIKKYLLKWEYEVQLCINFKEILREVTEFKPDLILLDIMLPFYNGFYWCGEIRKLSKVPIIFISSADQNMNIVMAMDIGGDDFIAKPFDLDVLRAKISALLRRTYSFKADTNVIEYKNVFLNIKDATISYLENTAELTKNEFKIIQLLMENSEEIVSREALMTKLWDSDCFIDDNTLTVNVTRIKRKLTDIGVIDFIKTKRGLGYYI